MPVEDRERRGEVSVRCIWQALRDEHAADDYSSIHFTISSEFHSPPVPPPRRPTANKNHRHEERFHTSNRCAIPGGDSGYPDVKKMGFVTVVVHKNAAQTAVGVLGVAGERRARYADVPALTCIWAKNGKN